MTSAQTAVRKETLYLVLATLFSVIVIVSNLITVKFVAMPFFREYLVPCGLLTYPLTFLVSDLVTEMYGQHKARFMVYLGFSMSVIAHFIIQFAVKLPAHPEWIVAYNPFQFAETGDYQTAFSAVFKPNGIALFSSMAAYVVAQILDIQLFAFLKELTKNRYLWLRNGGSTLVSQVVDTLVVNILFLYCGMKIPLDQVIYISMVCYLYKMFFTLCNVPLFYLAVWLSQRFLFGKQTKLLPHLSNSQQLDTILSTE